MEQRPAAVRRLGCGADRRRSCASSAGIDRLAEIVPQQHIFGRDGGIGLELEHPMAVGLLAGEQRLRRRLDACARGYPRCRREFALQGMRCRCPHALLFESVIDHGCFAMRSAARLPERIAPSMVAGRPVAVQSPARTRLRHWVRRARTFARPAPASRRRSRGARARSARAAATPAVRSRARLRPRSLPPAVRAARRCSRSPALMVTESRPGKAKSHCTVPLTHAEHRRRIRPADRCGNAR